MLARLRRDPRFVLSCILVVTLPAFFLFTSRTPALNEKAAMGGEIEFNALGFATVVQVQPNDSLLKKIVFTTINWMETNKVGMAFGITFAAALMTLLSRLKSRGFQGEFANSGLGMLIGAPLGVCVNCAAPIAYGMVTAGMRLETMLAAMVSSPTMNVIVVTMLFSMFPVYVAVTKLALTGVFVLVIIPLLARYVFRKEVRALAAAAALDPSDAACELPWMTGAEFEPEVGWFGGLRWLVLAYARNLWYVIKLTVPLMLLAGFLGSVVITVSPFESIAGLLPDDTFMMKVAAMGIVAMIGTFLPVPMAFDVIICSVLLTAGMPIRYVMVLLFTLGVFSVYPFLIVWEKVSLRAASILFVVLSSLGFTAGVIGHQFDQWRSGQAQALFAATLGQTEGGREPWLRPPGGAALESSGGFALAAVEREPWESAALEAGAGTTVRRAAFAARSPGGATPFTRIEGPGPAMNRPSLFSFYRLFPPFENGYGMAIATGDVQNDGFMDVLLLQNFSLSILTNSGEGLFESHPMDLPAINDMAVVGAALVDLNNDGWLDVFLSTMHTGSYVAYSDRGSFVEANMVPLPSPDPDPIVASFGFGDLDEDGDLDIVLGTWVPQLRSRWSSSVRSRNYLLINDGGDFRLDIASMPSLPGVPLSILVRDIDEDGHVDIIIGNDGWAPDFFYRGDGTGAFTPFEKDVIPHSTQGTMSIVTADVDNDLSAELYFTAFSRYSDEKADMRRWVDPSRVCEEVAGEESRTECFLGSTAHTTFADARRSENAGACQALPERRLQEDCIVAYFVNSPEAYGGVALCDQLSESWRDVRAFCRSRLDAPFVPSEEDLDASVVQAVGKNVLLAPTPQGGFTDRATAAGLEFGGWAWNARFADLDLDEWQDMFIVNGFYPSIRVRESNYLFMNDGSGTFLNRTDDSGLTSHLATTSYSYVDVDNDGDLDIITVPLEGPIMLFTNNAAGRTPIAFGLRDHAGNAFGVGARITIEYAGSTGRTRHQMRDIDISGGFQSFDASVAYFGLGEFAAVDRVEVRWSNGETTTVDGPFDTGYRYLIERASPN